MAFNMSLVKDLMDGVSLAVSTVEAGGAPGPEKKAQAVDLVLKGVQDAGMTLNPIVVSVLKFCLPLLIDFVVGQANAKGFFKPSNS